MGELHSGHRAGFLHELCDAAEGFGVGVGPDAAVGRGNAAFRASRRWLRPSPSAAPPMARLPKCTRCQSVGRPSLLEYWHIGETKTRFLKVSLRIWIGEKRWLTEYQGLGFGIQGRLRRRGID